MPSPPQLLLWLPGMVADESCGGSESNEGIGDRIAVSSTMVKRVVLGYSVECSLAYTVSLRAKPYRTPVLRQGQCYGMDKAKPRWVVVTQVGDEGLCSANQ
ncbi:hypothetical protein O3M35_008530 [Rhynocoris fuscipes]|uniref:Secreted protein n=1 Tax=Rhynocoris fuscipes TaxID=488301 RepID=A0AAW1DA43_9HEMI